MLKKQLFIILVLLSSVVFSTPLEVAFSKKQYFQAGSQLIKQLTREKRISNEFIQKVINHYASEDFIVNKTYEKSLLFLKQMETIELSTANKAFLHKKQSELYSLSNDIDNAIIYSKKAIAEYKKYALKADLARLTTMVNLATEYRLKKENDKAEKLYLDVLSHPWYLVEDTDIRGQMRDVYLTAGTNLIQVRSGNLAKLKQISFVPATRKELMPLLKRAIKDAGGK